MRIYADTNVLLFRAFRQPQPIACRIGAFLRNEKDLASQAALLMTQGLSFTLFYCLVPSFPTP
jgi:hypothetical protein